MPEEEQEQRDEQEVEDHYMALRRPEEDRLLRLLLDVFRETYPRLLYAISLLPIPQLYQLDFLARKNTIFNTFYWDHALSPIIAAVHDIHEAGYNLGTEFIEWQTGIPVPPQVTSDIDNDLIQLMDGEYPQGVRRGGFRPIFKDTLSLQMSRHMEQVDQRVFSPELLATAILSGNVINLERSLEINPHRAENIVITELSMGVNKVDQSIIERAPEVATRFIWTFYTMEDERVCPICSPRHELPASQAGFPPLHPRCRCFVLLIERTIPDETDTDEEPFPEDIKKFQHAVEVATRNTAKVAEQEAKRYDNTNPTSQPLSIKQKRFLRYAVKEGLIRIPYQRTGNLKQSWFTAIHKKGHQYRIELGNRMPYAGYVMGFSKNRQRPYFNQIGWKSIDRRMKRIESRIQSFFKKLL